MVYRIGRRAMNDGSTSGIYEGAWRPAIGWLCVLGIAWQLMLAPLLTWLSPLLRIPPPPATDLETLAVLLPITLGIAGLRSLDKIKGVAR